VKCIAQCVDRVFGRCCFAEMMVDQIQGLLGRAVGYDVFGEAFVDIRSAALLVTCRAYAPAGAGLWPADVARFAAGQSIAFGQERVLVACLDMQYVLLKRTNYTLQLLKERILIDVLSTIGSTWSDTRHMELHEQQA
jgi:hypothetical protein